MFKSSADFYSSGLTQKSRFPKVRLILAEIVLQDPKMINEPTLFPNFLISCYIETPFIILGHFVIIVLHASITQSIWSVSSIKFLQIEWSFLNFNFLRFSWSFLQVL